MNKLNRKIGITALIEIIILVISIVAFSYLVGENFSTVSAQTKETPKETQKKAIQTAVTLPVYTKYAEAGWGELGKILTNPENVEEGVVNPATSAKPEAAGWMTKILGPTVTNIVSNLAAAAAIYGGIRLASGLLKLNPNLANALSWAGAAYYIGQWGAYHLLQTGIGQSLLGWLGSVGLASFIVGAVVALIVFLALWKKEDTRVVQFNCELWDAPSGGKDCEKCNDGVLPCTEYRCESLGQSCELVNKGTAEQLCIWNNRNDNIPPIIQTWLKILTIGYQYTPDNSISPPDRGVKIVPTGDSKGCIKAFTALRFGVTLDEPAKCKISSTRASTFDTMQGIMLSGGASLYNHSYQLSLPNAEALASENITITPGEDYSLYIKCQDKNGNSNTADFVFSFCVDEGPDTTPPMIMSTSIINGMPFAFNQTSVDLSVYVNEPAECRWSKTDLSYDDMENNMDCDTGVLQMNAQGLYECSTTLTGLNDRVDNIFYFKCKDQPWLAGADESSRNSNEESYKFTLKGTEALYIKSAEPNETTIRDSTDSIKVTLKAETSAGYNKGQAICSYEGYGTKGNYIEFYKTNSYIHSQDVWLPEGNYTYNIGCVDLGGNADNTVLSFNVETDNEQPIVVRVYSDANSLKIITNENATCVYSYADNLACEYSFEDGIDMGTSSNGKIHFTGWDKTKTFYIKCQDDFGNRPIPDQCSIIAKPFEV